MQSAQLPITKQALLVRFWHTPELTVARFTLKTHLRSWWLLGDAIFIWFLYALFFFDSGGNVSYFYATAGEGLSILAVLDTIIIVQRSLKNARVYLPLARLSSRSAYMRGLILATSIWRIPLFLVMLLLALGYHKHSPHFGINDATAINMLPGAIGLLMNCIILSLITILLSVPIATRRIQIIFLAWLAAVFYANTHSDSIANYLIIAQIPLTPLTVCYNIGLNATIDGYGVLMLIVAVGYISILTYLADLFLARRDLILQ